MGPKDLPVPSCAPLIQSASESSERGHSSNFDLPKVALSNVVDVSAAVNGGATIQAASLPFFIDELDRGSNDQLSGTPGGSGDNEVQILDMI